MNVYGLPGWLVAGLLMGALFSAAAAVVFLAGTRLFPTPETARGATVSTDDRRRKEVRGYLRYIGEPFAEDHHVAGQTVAFYLPEREVAVTFDARAYFRIQGTDVQPVLLEHEVPGAGLGARLPFETPDGGRRAAAGRGARPAGRGARPPGDERVTGGPADPTAAAFAALGLPPSATAEEVRTAYRERLKDVHPDQGGDPESFRRLREAYTVAREAAS